MPSATYICKSCGATVHYPARQDQDKQPVVEFLQTGGGVDITIRDTEWLIDEQGRKINTLTGTTEVIRHACP